MEQFILQFHLSKMRIKIIMQLKNVKSELEIIFF